MENILPYIIQAGELVGAAILGGWVSRVLTIRERIKIEKANAKKVEQEAKSDQIENIEKMVEKAYKPIIEDLTNKVQTLTEKVNALETLNDEMKDKIDVLEDENKTLRSIVHEVRPDIVPSQRSINAKRQAATRPRGNNGQFVKKEDA